MSLNNESPYERLKRFMREGRQLRRHVSKAPHTVMNFVAGVGVVPVRISYPPGGVIADATKRAQFISRTLAELSTRSSRFRRLCGYRAGAVRPR